MTTFDCCLRHNHQPGVGCQNVDTRPDKEPEPLCPDLFLHHLFTDDSTFKGQTGADVSQKPARLTTGAPGM